VAHPDAAASNPARPPALHVIGTFDNSVSRRRPTLSSRLTVISGQTDLLVRDDLAVRIITAWPTNLAGHLGTLVSSSLWPANPPVIISPPFAVFGGLFSLESTLSSLTISLITFAFVFGGALFGIVLRAVLPQNELNSDSRDVVKLGMGLVATLAALVLGLLIAAAKTSFDTQNLELTDLSSKAVLLDRVLAHCGPESQEAGTELRSSVAHTLDTIFSKDASQLESTKGELLYDKIQGLSPQDDARRSIQAQALSLILALGQTRWLMAEQRVNSISVPLLVVLIFWLTIIFTSFGLFAPRNTTVVVSLFVTSLSVSGAIFLIIEMYSPYTGLIHVSSDPLRAALSLLGQ
jgi:hypothetical protein